MHTLGVVLSIIIGVIALASAGAKIAGVSQVTEMLDHVKVGAPVRQALPYIQIAGGVGTLLGLVVLAGVGVAASAGLALYFAGAVAFHVRVNDGPKDFAVPGLLAVVALLATIVRAATL